MPENCAILKLTTKIEVDALLTYKPKPRISVLEEAFPLGEYLVKGVRARGVRLTTKEVKSAKFVKGNPDGDKKETSGTKPGAPKPTAKPSREATKRSTSDPTRSAKGQSKSGTGKKTKSTRSSSRNGSKKKTGR